MMKMKKCLTIVIGLFVLTSLILILSTLLYSGKNVEESNSKPVAHNVERKAGEEKWKEVTAKMGNDMSSSNENKRNHIRNNKKLVLAPTPEIIEMEEKFVKLGMNRINIAYNRYTYSVSDKTESPLTLETVFALTGLTKKDFIPIEASGLMPRESKWLAEKNNIQCVISLHETQIKRDKCWVFDEIVPQGQEITKILYISITARRHPDSVSPLRKYKASYKTMKVEGGVVTFGE